MRQLILTSLFFMLIGCSGGEPAQEPGGNDAAASTPGSASASTDSPPTGDIATPPPTMLDEPVETVTPEGLKIITFAIGNGEQATAGSTVSVHYTGWLQDETAEEGKGTQFDSSVERGKPIDFPLGAGRVIKGWDQGIEGMRVGGKRRLIIPSDLAYGKRGRPPVIPQSATLIFDVELMDVVSAAQ